MESFSMKLKNELVGIEASDEALKGMLEGMLQISGTINISASGLYLEFKTKSEKVANELLFLIKYFYKAEAVLLKTKELRLNKDDVYLVRLFQNASFILNDLKVMQAKNDTSYSLKKDLTSDEMKIGYLRGAFLSSGSINDPEAMIYHLEIQTFNTIIAVNLRDLMNVFNLNAKISKNRRGYIVYVKSAEKIADFIRILGSSDSLFYYEDLRIKRDLSNSINRVMNCEIANQKKATETAMRQIEEIDKVMKFYGEGLQKSVKEACLLRKENPEDSLNELADKSEARFGKSLSKSALNHRLRAMHELFIAIPSGDGSNNILEK